MVNLRRKTENYGFKPVYITGSDNGAPDAWSRRVPNKAELEKAELGEQMDGDSAKPNEWRELTKT